MFQNKYVVNKMISDSNLFVVYLKLRCLNKITMVPEITYFDVPSL